MSLSGEKWKKSRLNISSTFTTTKLKIMFTNIIKGCEKLENNFSISCDQVIDITDVTSRYVTDNIAICVFGIVCNSLKYPNTELYVFAKSLTDDIFKSLYWNFFAVNFMYLMRIFKLAITNKKAREYLLNLLKEILEKREKVEVPRNDFLEYYINMKKGEENSKIGHKISNNQKKENKNELSENSFNEFASLAYTFYITGYTSTSTAMSYFLYEMAINQDIQKKLRAEIINIITKYDGKLTYESLNDMEYLDKVTCGE